MTAPSTLDDVLTDRQLRFVFEYLIDQNASAAAARVGYSEKSSAWQGRELMKVEAVRERIRLELASLLAEAGCAEMPLILERRRAAFFRAEQMLGAGWEPLPPGEMAEDARRAVEVCTVMGKGGPVIKVRQPDRHKALRALERVHERLEKANEAYWARLEKKGGYRSLAEIDALYAAEGEAAAENGEKAGGLYGCGGEAAAPVGENREKDGGLSGSGHYAAPFDKLRASGGGGGISSARTRDAGISPADGGERVVSPADGSEEVMGEKPAVLPGVAGRAAAPAGRIAVPDLILAGVADLPERPARGAMPAPARLAANPMPLAAHWLMRNAPRPSGLLRVG